MRFFNSILFSLVLFFSACNNQNEKAELLAKPFFYLVGFFNAEALRLDSLGVVVHTTIMLNDEISNSIDSTPSWDKTFQLLKGFDINKAATASSFIADTAYQNNGNMHIHIESQNEKMLVQNMRIILDTFYNPILIEISAGDKSFFKEEYFTYSYIRDKAYGIQGSRKGLFSDEKMYEIIGELNF